ncbi:hypothetical protein [Cellulomonas sp.]|uniref:hypothetical protein n=1 Tax=Cellulomonas sp. TaxID=40001 RepID=UPI00281248E1|nr:hypothetical protein [Cellulomonas sp.]
MKMQVYVDETKAKGYVIAAAVIPMADLDHLRKAMRGLLPRGQRRIHMVSESEPLRRKILAVLGDEGAQVDLYAAGRTRVTDIDRRRACLEQLVRDLAATCILLTLESDETQDRRDRRDLAAITHRAGCPELRYGHQTPYVEPLLWIPDAVGWAYARGGEWRRLAAPSIRRVVAV